MDFAENTIDWQIKVPALVIKGIHCFGIILNCDFTDLTKQPIKTRKLDGVTLTDNHMVTGKGTP